MANGSGGVMWPITRSYVPVRSLSRVTRGDRLDPQPIPQTIGLRWGRRADFSHVIDDGANRDRGPEIKLQDRQDPEEYARILRASATVTTRIARIDGESAGEYLKVRRFERMQWKYSERIPKRRFDESQRYRHVEFDLRFALQPPDENEEGDAE